MSVGIQLPDVQDVHVAPLPLHHVAAVSCFCEPVPSISISGSTVYVHRTAERRPGIHVPGEKPPWME